MPRRGWSKADVLAGWIQIVRGPRPRSVQWPRADSVRSPVQSPKAPPPPHQPTFKSAKDKVSPDAAREAARNKIFKLERALEVMSDSSGPSVDALKSELEKARQAAKAPPLIGANHLDPRFHSTFREACGGIGSRAHCRTKVARGGPGAVASLGGRPQCRRICNSVSASHPDGSGGPSAEFAANGQPTAGRAGCVGQGSPGWHRGETQSASTVVGATRLRRCHPTNAHIGSARALGVDGGPSVRHAGGDVVRELEEVVGVDISTKSSRRETRRNDRRHGVLMRSRRTFSRYGHRGSRVGEATHPGPRLRSNLLKREGLGFRRSRSRPTQVDSDREPLVSSSGCAFSSDCVAPRPRDREDSNDEEDLPLSTLVTPVSQPASLMPTWVDSPEDPRPKVLLAVSSSIPGRKPPTVYDLTEVDSEDDSDCDSGPESFVFNPVESDDDLDSVIDALERDLEDGGASVLQPAAEDVQEVAPEVDMQDIPVVGIRPRSRSIEFLDRSCAVSASGACASATPQGRVATFADRGVKRLRVIPRGSVALGSELATDEHRPSAGETLIDHPSEFPEDDRDHMSDTQSVDSRGGHSDFEGDPDSEVAPAPDPVPAITGHLENLSASFEWLASVDLESVFSQRACVMKAVPGFMRGAYRSAMRLALAEIDEGRAHNMNLRMSRGWKLFLLLPRLLLFRPPRGGKIPKAQLHRRFEAFARGEWASLMDCGQECTSRGAQASSRRRRRANHDDQESRAARAEALVQMGELSSARQALEGAAVAPGNEETRAALQNPERRPPCLLDPIPPDILNAAPVEPFVLDAEDFARNVRSAKRGAAGGPSGMTADHLRLILESELDTRAFCRAAQDLARAQVPPDVVAVLRMGRITALQKPGGGVRGIVCGDIVRRLVARTIAQKITPAVLEATSPFQYALGSKAGGESVAHAIQSLTDMDSRATVLSIDGISAFDMISRAAMLDGMGQIRGGEAVLPFVLQFYSQPSEYLWTDDYGDNHVILQGEGGEQGDALMPMLCSLGQHGALQEVQDSLMPDEYLFAYLDDIYVVCLPERVSAIYKLLGQALEENARIQMHLGKTQVWNRGGHMPPGCDSMQVAAQRVDPHARVWRGEGPSHEQGIRVLGIPIGHVDFVQAQLRSKTEMHRVLHERLLSVQDLQSAWLLLLFCANARATYSLRGIPPSPS